MTTGTLFKEKHLIGVAYSFRGLLIIIRMEHEGMKADVVLGKNLRVLHLDLQATGSELSPWACFEYI